MLEIRKEQVEVFQPSAEDAFVRRVVAELRTGYFDLVSHLPPSTLESRVRFGIEKGRSQGLTWESSLTGFVIIMFQFGPDFDELDPFRDALEAEISDENERILWMYDSVSYAERDRLRRSADKSQWLNDVVGRNR